MSVGAVNKQTGDRIPTAGMPAIDDALDLTSVNPVQNAIITAALGDKQDSTDNNLQTTDKTIVGAINEHEGDIGSLMSGLTNLADVPVYTTDSALITDFRGKHDYYKTIVMSDSTKTMALLNEVNEEKVYVVLVENQQMWRNHPNFYAFLQDEVWVGILNIGENSVSVSVCNKLVKSSDNNLTTTDKTVVGAINEVRSGLTNYENQNNINLEVANRKNILPVSLANVKAKNTSGTWTGNTYAINSGEITFTANADGYITEIVVNGTFATNTTFFKLRDNFSPFETKNYILSGVVADTEQEVIQIYFHNDTDDIDVNPRDKGQGATISLNKGKSYTCYLRISTGTQIDNESAYPMLRETWQNATFAPYIPSVESRIEAVESDVTGLIENVTFEPYQAPGSDPFAEDGSGYLLKVTYQSTLLGYLVIRPRGYANPAGRKVAIELFDSEWRGVWEVHRDYPE